jgi:hypothetical protein
MLYPDSHKCPPVFSVLIEDYHGDDFEDGIQVHVRDAETAAEKAIEEWDSDGDYTCAGGSEVNVTVKGPDGVVKKFVVTAEARPVYYASEV